VSKKPDSPVGLFYIGAYLHSGKTPAQFQLKACIIEAIMVSQSPPVSDAAQRQATAAQIGEYLHLFDNDSAAAIEAIHTYVEPERPHQTSQPQGKVLITATDVRKEYRVGRQMVQAVNGVSLDIYEGEFIAITGTSGSGKSTLLQLLGGLDKPSSGSITVDGVSLTSMSDRKLSRFRGQTIGFVFQFFYLQPFLTLARNLEVPGMFARRKRADRQARVRELAAAVGLSDRLDRLPRELSGGQIQRAAIARALLNNPKVILADEPTGNLDSKNGTAIIDLFEHIRKEFGTTIVVVTHDYAIARRADRQIVIKDGVLA
jgi:ABC-type lipoprotein export system ATPase subunit